MTFIHTGWDFMLFGFGLSCILLATGQVITLLIDLVRAIERAKSSD